MVIKRNAFLVIAFLITGVAGAQDWDAYRVAGTLTSSDGRRMAIVELPGEKSSLVAEGDAVGEGYVVEISAEWLLIGGLDEGELRLPLRGGAGTFLTAAEEYRDLVVQAEDQENVHTRVVDAVRLLAAVERLAEAPDGVSVEELTREFDNTLRQLLALPADARVVDVDHQPIASSSEALELIRNVLVESPGNVLTLTLEGADGGMGRVYVSSDRTMGDAVGNP